MSFSLTYSLAPRSTKQRIQLQASVFLHGNLMQAYWYDERPQPTVYSAETILSLLLPCLPPVRSAVDRGCGVGPWLSVLQARGAQDLLDRQTVSQGPTAKDW